jgi:D-arabinose 1-dehydrogenase-like Zn-dependent alcohol dehydrogenase
MKKKMRAALLHKIGEQLSIETVKVPKLKANEVTTKIKATGICQLDINYHDAHAPLFPFLKKLW